MVSITYMVNQPSPLLFFTLLSSNFRLPHLSVIYSLVIGHQLYDSLHVVSEVEQKHYVHLLRLSE